MTASRQRRRYMEHPPPGSSPAVDLHAIALSVTADRTATNSNQRVVAIVASTDSTENVGPAVHHPVEQITRSLSDCWELGQTRPGAARVDHGSVVERGCTRFAQRVNAAAPGTVQHFDIHAGVGARADRPHHVVEAAGVDVVVNDDHELV